MFEFSDFAAETDVKVATKAPSKTATSRPAMRSRRSMPPTPPAADEPPSQLKDFNTML